MARLVLFTGPRLTNVLELTTDGVDLAFDGRHLRCGHSGSVDRPHLRFSMADDMGTVSFVRLGSSPPVALDGRTTEGAPLSSGDRISVGDHVIFLWNPAPEQKAMSETDLRLLFSMTRDLSLVDFDHVMTRMLDRLMDVFDSERGFILLRNRRTGRLEQAVARKIPDSEMGSAASRTIVRRVLAERTTITLGDAGSELDDAHSIRTEGIRSVIAAPLRDGNDVFGVVYLDSQALRKIYTPRELTLLDAFVVNVSTAIKAALQRTELERDVKFLKALRAREAQRDGDTGAIVGPGPAMTEIRHHIADVAAQDVTVLVLGESGTGKELVARAIHENSRRSDGPFVAVNCMALSREVTESELFGHERGSFTGATEQRIGRFELADGGTLFLDEIGELDADIQVKLLRVLEERRVERVGGNRPIDVDVRIVAATNRSLRREVADGRFRDDLFYRLNVFSLELPPLRSHPEDLPALLDHFVDLCNRKMGRTIEGCTAPALQALLVYRWPGNVRELRNVIERAFILEKGRHLQLSSLPGDITDTVAPTTRSLGSVAVENLPAGTTLTAAREAFELDYMGLVLRRHGGNVAKAASELGIPRSTIYRKFQAAGIDPKRP